MRVGESQLPTRWRKKLGLWRGATWFDAVAVGMFQAGANGNPEAAREIREAIEGRAPLRIQLIGEADRPIALAELFERIFEKVAA